MTLQHLIQQLLPVNKAELRASQINQQANIVHIYKHKTCKEKDWNKI